MPDWIASAEEWQHLEALLVEALERADRLSPIVAANIDTALEILRQYRDRI